MKLAIPHWQGRISPVFDVAALVLIVEIDGAHELNRRDVAFDVEEPRARAAQLAATGADVLICGAISGPLETALSAVGVEVIPHVCGNVESVRAAFVEGRLNQEAFLMPGCCGRRRRFGAGHGRGGQRGGPLRSG
jgi:predicted Fe-Mo cluster-binding NifX family protein